MGFLSAPPRFKASPDGDNPLAPATAPRRGASATSGGDVGAEGVDIYIAIHDYTARTDSEMSFQKGEHLKLKDIKARNNWWRVERLINGQIGWAPSNYIAQSQGHEARPWFHGPVIPPFLSPVWLVYGAVSVCVCVVQPERVHDAVREIVCAVRDSVWCS